MTLIKLVAHDRDLYTPNGAIVDREQREWHKGADSLLMADYGMDCDTVCWPNPDLKVLRHALFDAREMGTIPADTKAVLLPDDTQVEIDGGAS